MNNILVTGSTGQLGSDVGKRIIKKRLFYTITKSL